MEVSSVAEMVGNFRRNGWRLLSVFRGDVEVGGITKDLDTGKRTWWAEADRVT